MHERQNTCPHGVTVPSSASGTTMQQAQASATDGAAGGSVAASAPASAPASALGASARRLLVGVTATATAAAGAPSSAGLPPICLRFFDRAASKASTASRADSRCSTGSHVLSAAEKPSQMTKYSMPPPPRPLRRPTMPSTSQRCSGGSSSGSSLILMLANDGQRPLAPRRLRALILL